MELFTQGKTNWKYILIVLISTILVSGGVLGYLRLTKEEFEISPIEISEKVAEKEIICDVSDPLYCKNDQDCICRERGCFMGNKYYYEKCINKDKLCFHHCGFYGLTIISKCSQNKCTFKLKRL